MAHLFPFLIHLLPVPVVCPTRRCCMMHCSRFACLNVHVVLNLNIKLNLIFVFIDIDLLNDRSIRDSVVL
jgi:hypothetical protein